MLDVKTVLVISMRSISSCCWLTFWILGTLLKIKYKSIICKLSDQICTTFHYKSLHHQCIYQRIQPNISRKILSDLVAMSYNLILIKLLLHQWINTILHLNSIHWDALFFRQLVLWWSWSNPRRWPAEPCS